MTDPTTDKAHGIALPAGRWETFEATLDGEVSARRPQADFTLRVQPPTEGAGR